MLQTTEESWPGSLGSLRDGDVSLSSANPVSRTIFDERGEHEITDVGNFEKFEGFRVVNAFFW